MERVHWEAPLGPVFQKHFSPKDFHVKTRQSFRPKEGDQLYIVYSPQKSTLRGHDLRLQQDGLQLDQRKAFLKKVRAWTKNRKEDLGQVSTSGTLGFLAIMGWVRWPCDLLSV